MLITNCSGPCCSGFCLGQVAYPRAAHTTTSNVPDRPASLSLCTANFLTGVGSTSAPLRQLAYSACHVPPSSMFPNGELLLQPVKECHISAVTAWAVPWTMVVQSRRTGRILAASAQPSSSKENLMNTVCPAENLTPSSTTSTYPNHMTVISVSSLSVAYWGQLLPRHLLTVKICFDVPLRATGTSKKGFRLLQLKPGRLPRPGLPPQISNYHSSFTRLQASITLALVSPEVMGRGLASAKHRKHLLVQHLHPLSLTLSFVLFSF